MLKSRLILIDSATLLAAIVHFCKWTTTITSKINAAQPQYPESTVAARPHARTGFDNYNLVQQYDTSSFRHLDLFWSMSESHVFVVRLGPLQFSRTGCSWPMLVRSRPCSPLLSPVLPRGWTRALISAKERTCQRTTGAEAVRSWIEVERKNPTDMLRLVDIDPKLNCRLIWKFGCCWSSCMLPSKNRGRADLLFYRQSSCCPIARDSWQRCIRRDFAQVRCSWLRYWVLEPRSPTRVMWNSFGFCWRNRWFTRLRV